MSESSEQHGLSLGALTPAQIVSSGNERYLLHREANVERTVREFLDIQALDCSLFRAGESSHGVYKIREGIVISFDLILAIRRPL